MKDKEKAAFLRAEGWKCVGRFISTDEWDSYVMPGTGRDGKDYVFAFFPHAYQIAKRRKSQREARLLRKAGWAWFGSGWYNPRSIQSRALTRGEAVKLLTSRKGS